MSTLKDIKDSIKKLSKTDDVIYSLACTVSNIDEANKTCDCVPIDGSADLLEVRLMADNKTGFLIVPKNDSIVVVTMLNNFTGYVSMFSEIDKILLNGENYDGLVRVADLTTKLNNLENAFNQHIIAYNLHTHVGVTVGAGVTGITTPDTQVLTPTTQIEIENLTVKHGNG